MEKILDNSITGKRSIHKSHPNWLGSADFGRIVPFYWKELVGTDKVVSVKPRIEMQMLPFASPTFGQMDLYVHYFFVPHRLLMDNYYDFSTNTGTYRTDKAPYWNMLDFYNVYLRFKNLASEGQDPETYSRPVFKHWTSMGLPPFFSVAAGWRDQPISLLPFRAYNRIWWDYYRDPELLRDESVEQYLYTKAGHQSEEVTPSLHPFLCYAPLYRNIKDTWVSELFSENGSISPIGEKLADLRAPDVTSFDKSSVNYRYVEAVTRMAERFSLSGKRQIDMLYSRYGIKPEWNKLQMCQYVGGGKASILVSDIVSQADTTDGNSTTEIGQPLGAKAGAGYCALSDINIEYTAAEPGILMGVLSVMPKVRYVQGIGRRWNRVERDDFFTRELEHVGQVAVAKQEIACAYGNMNGHTRTPTDSTASALDTFAFTQPYYDYKYDEDILAGDFMYYHGAPAEFGSPDGRDILYMQSMDMFIDYPLDRRYDPESIQVNPLDFNKVFYYLGGSWWSNADDHFHINVVSDCVLNRPMDGYAVPTLETTEDPHAAKAPIAGDREL